MPANRDRTTRRRACRAHAAIALVLAGCPGRRTQSDPGDARVDAADAFDAPVAPDAHDVPSPPRCPGPFGAASASERALRERLGIPADAACAVFFAQNSHLDIDWRNTFEGYYATWVEPILSSANELLSRDPAYRYQICEMGYLMAHLGAHPEQLPTMNSAAQRGALHVVGGGITSPDTLLPTDEALIADYLRGGLFAESALHTRPHAAWLPDSFGHSPTVPDLLAGMGFRSVGFARVDGMHSGIETAIWHQPNNVPGSTAALLRDMHTTDFVWVGPGGGEVIAHWMPENLYCQGDTIDHTGTPVPYGFIAGESRAGDRAYSDAQIASYVSALAPLARTPYMFVPVGCDFQPPKTELNDIVAHWNATHYAMTGIYAIASPFDDYADLVSERRADLPRIQRDITPYWSGYFGSRMAVKAGARAVGDLLLQAEATLLLADRLAGTTTPPGWLWNDWNLFARTNHHDFITGTSLDAVVTGEQLPLIEGLHASARGKLATLLSSLASWMPGAGPPASVMAVGTIGARGLRTAVVDLALAPGVASDLAADTPSQLLDVTRRPDGSIARARMLLVTPPLAPLSVQRIALADRVATGPVTATRTPSAITLHDGSTNLDVVIDPVTGTLQHITLDGRDWLSGPSGSLRGWRDQGGLYRIGSETRGCRFEPLAPSTAIVTVDVLEQGPARATVRVGRGVETSVTFGITAGMRRVDVDVQASAPVGQTLTFQLETAIRANSARFAVPAGFVTRPAAHLYEPTFWPTVRGMDVVAPDGSGVAILPRASTGIRFGSDGTLDVMVARNAVSEVCDALGADGHDQGNAIVSLAIRPHGEALDVLAEAIALLDAPAIQLGAATGPDRSGALYALAGGGWVLNAAKRADRGAGVILRFERSDGPAPVRLDLAPGLASFSAVTHTDLLEYDLGPAANPIVLGSPFTTLRLTP